MKKFSLILLIWLVAWVYNSPVAAQTIASPPAATAFRDATVIDMKAAKPKRGQTVVVSGNRIVAVGKTSKVKIPDGATIVDARGKFLIPGLWDMHVHFWDANVFYPIALANGVTGIRDMGDELTSLVRYRREIDAGTRLGPRIFFGGQIIDGLRRENLPFLFDYAQTADEARAFVGKRKTGGADFVKVYTHLAPEVYAAVAAESGRQNLPFAGHVPVAVGARAAANAGQKSFEHLTGIPVACASDEERRRAETNDLLTEMRRVDGERAQLKGEQAEQSATRAFEIAGKIFALNGDDALDRFDAAKCADLFRLLRDKGTWQVPTLVGDGNYASPNVNQFADERLRYFPEFVRRLIKQNQEPSPDRTATAKRRFQIKLEIVRAMRRARVKILAGSDAPNPNAYPGFSLHDELEFLVAAGFAPIEALRAATVSPAEFFGKAGEMGTIEPGKLADLVLLDANPLADIRHTRRIRAVVANGRLLTREMLDEMLQKAESKNAAAPKK